MKYNIYITTYTCLSNKNIIYKICKYQFYYPKYTSFYFSPCKNYHAEIIANLETDIL